MMFVGILLLLFHGRLQCIVVAMIVDFKYGREAC